MIRMPLRQGKPRLDGLTHVLDRGLPLAGLASVFEAHAPMIDLWKFGWGTALVSREIRAKIALCKQHAVTPVLGGTLFEYCVLTDQFSAFCAYLDQLELTTVEVSNGTTAIEAGVIQRCVRHLARERTVLSEVGCKSLQQAERMGLEDWTAQIAASFEAGASLVILEARESGRSGFCTPDGQPRTDFCHTFIDRFGAERLLFEAPTTTLQSTLIRAHGNTLNLANISPKDVLSLETLRLGLRFDTLARFPLPSELVTDSR